MPGPMSGAGPHPVLVAKSRASLTNAQYESIVGAENPFNGAVKFSTRPPAKRFSDVSLLSGGLSSLAHAEEEEQQHQ